jgi:hypothetical protein
MPLLNKAHPNNNNTDKDKYIKTHFTFTSIFQLIDKGRQPFSALAGALDIQLEYFTYQSSIRNSTSFSTGSSSRSFPEIFQVFSLKDPMPNVQT